MVRGVDVSRSDAWGLAAFLAAASYYTLTLAGIYLADSLAVKIAFGAANGLAIGLLFIVGHDACHGALMRTPWANALLGRLAFLPSLHPYVAWAYSHNALHHSWTNLKGRDPVYAPLTVAEFDRLSPLQKRRERFERSMAGVGLLYLRTIWWRFEIAPDNVHSRAMRRVGPYAADRALVFLFLALHLAFAVYVANGRIGALAALVLLAILLPFLVWNWLMGFVTYHHHTHPSLQWFDDEKEWTFFRGQILGTAHVVPPALIDLLLFRIMQHTAHHVDPTIPLYRLRTSQRTLAGLAPTYQWTLSECLSLFARCQLYDYQRRQWLDFAGRPT